MNPIKNFRMWLVERKYERYMREAEDKDDENWAALWLGCRTREIIGNGKKMNVRLELRERKRF